MYGPKISSILVELIDEHPFASVIVTEYVPGCKESMSSVVSPLLQMYEYGAVPAEMVRSAAPLNSPHVQLV